MHRGFEKWAVGHESIQPKFRRGVHAQGPLQQDTPEGVVDAQIDPRLRTIAHCGRLWRCATATQNAIRNSTWTAGNVTKMPVIRLVDGSSM